MPRKPRLWEPGDLRSGVGRGHEGQPLFAGDDDQRFFVERLVRVFRLGGVDLLAWAMLVEHDHRIIPVTDAAPESLFRRLNTALGMRERRRRGDHGTVFQGRCWCGRRDKEGAAVAVLTDVLGSPCLDGVVPKAEALESYDLGRALRVACGWDVDDVLSW